MKRLSKHGGGMRSRIWPEKVDEGCTLVGVDEAGFTLLPGCVRSWAPRGETPVIRPSARREHLTVIGGITPEGRYYQQVLDHAVRGADCVRYLWHLRAKIPGRLIIVWDNLPSHRGQVMRAFLGTHHAKRLELVALPGYAPDLNPEEGVWKHLKYVELANVCCSAMQELKDELRLAVQRMRQKPHVIKGCFAQAGYL